MKQHASISFDLPYFRQHNISYYGEAVSEEFFKGLTKLSFSGIISLWAYDDFENDFYRVGFEVEGKKPLVKEDFYLLFHQYQEAIWGAPYVENSPMDTKRSDPTFRGTVLITDGQVQKIKKEVDSWFIAAARDRINSGKHKAA
jgi:hypothetical protein